MNRIMLLPIFGVLLLVFGTILHLQPQSYKKGQCLIPSSGQGIIKIIEVKDYGIIFKAIYAFKKYNIDEKEFYLPFPDLNYHKKSDCITNKELE